MDKVNQFIEEIDYNINFKKTVNLRKPEEYLETITLFANMEKVGYIIFGVNQEKNEIIGIKKVKKSYQEIAQNIKIYIRPELEYIIKIAYLDEKNIILVKVIPKKGRIYYYAKELKWNC